MSSAPTTIADTASTPRTDRWSDQPPAHGQKRRSGGRVGTVVLMIVALVVSGVTRELATAYQRSNSPAARRTSTVGSSLAGMDTYALALLLGGLRGPLVMILWSQSEAQKAERNLEGIDTQIEWIRRLQPEFDTVHIFQIWNKAYNISVQMVGLSNKYTVILDALDYGKSVDAERPDNLNIIREIARVYGDKLATSNPEKYYYRDRLRRETRHRDSPTGSAQRGQRGFQRLAHDPLLDASGNILPQYLQPRFPGKEYDGSELQFLKRFEPFPFGVSPSALGYNYQKRAQLLMAIQKQKPLQVSTHVADSAPALSLKQWAEEEWERGRRLEFKVFGEPLPPDRILLEMPTAGFGLDAPLRDPSAIPEALYSYARSAQAVDKALVEYDRHLANPEFAVKMSTYDSHKATIRAIRQMALADHDYLQAIQVGPDSPQRPKLLASAADYYRKAVRDFALVSLKYFTADNIMEKVLPAGVRREDLSDAPLGAITTVTEPDARRLMAAVNAEVAKLGGPDYDANAEDRAEYETYIARATERLAQIERAAGGAAGGATGAADNAASAP